MSFPDLDSLKRRAAQRNFRQPQENETETEYRNAFADFMQDVDRVESGEIRLGVGWDVAQHDPATLLQAMGLGNVVEEMRNK